jgi:predicted phage terminase large subunit-like protein
MAATRGSSRRPRASTSSRRCTIAAIPRATSARTEWRSWIFDSYSNPHLKREEIDRIAAEMPELVRRQEIGGKFVDLSGASVHRDWVKDRRIPLHAAPLDRDRRRPRDLAEGYGGLHRDRRARALDRWPRLRLDVKRFRLPFNAILKEIERAAKQWSPDVIGIESVQFQAAVVQELLRTTNLPVVGVPVHKDKLVRFQPVLARYEQGLVYHVPGLSAEFEEELFAFPLGEYLDQCDAISIAYAVLSRSRGWPHGRRRATHRLRGR